MKLLAQHGYAKSTRIEDAAVKRLIQGAVLNPRYESPSNLKAYILQLRALDNLDIMIDPSAYCTSVLNAKLGKLTEYPISLEYENPQRFSVRRVQGLVESLVGYQIVELPGLSHIISPSVFIDGLGMRTAQTSLNFLETALTYRSEVGFDIPMIHSLLLDENTLKTNPKEIDDFLDELTLYNVDGFYIVVKRDGTYRQSFEPTALASLMHIVYILSLQGYYLVVGYSDLVSLLLWSVGASSCASGWLHGLRSFSLKPIEPTTTGGRHPRPRYTSAPLLNSIFYEEFRNLEAKDALQLIVSGTSADTDRLLQPDSASVTEVAHHWEVMNMLKNGLERLSIPERLNKTQELIQEAKRIYGTLSVNYGAAFEPLTGPSHLDDWDEAIVLFRNRLNL